MVFYLMCHRCINSIYRLLSCPTRDLGVILSYIPGLPPQTFRDIAESHQLSAEEMNK